LKIHTGGDRPAELVRLFSSLWAGEIMGKRLPPNNAPLIKRSDPIFLYARMCFWSAAFHD
jgi:hypothetical protein